MSNPNPVLFLQYVLITARRTSSCVMTAAVSTLAMPVMANSTVPIARMKTSAATVGSSH